MTNTNKQTEQEKNKYLARKMMTTLCQLTGKRLSQRKMEKWYKENEARLVFDPENEEYIMGIRGAGAPIRNQFGCPIAMISVDGPKYRISLAELKKYGKLVSETAREISRWFGFKE